MRVRTTTVLSFIATALAYRVTTPSQAQGWTNSGAQPLAWERVVTDPLSFEAVLVNQVNFPPFLLVLQTQVDGKLLSASLNPPDGGLPTGSGYQVNFVQLNDVNTILAQSSQFTITAGAANTTGAATTIGTPTTTTRTPGTTSGTTTSTSNTISPAYSSSRAAIAPAVGGAVGGILFVTATIFAIFYFRRRRTRRDPEIFPEQKDRSSHVARTGIDGGHGSGGSPPARNDHSHTPTSSPLDSLPILTGEPRSAKVAEADMDQLANLLPTPMTLPPWPSSPHPTSAITATSSRTSESPRSYISQSNTEEEAQLIHRLYSLNLPALEIARVVEGMRAERERRSASSDVLREYVQSTQDLEAPPGYNVRAK